MLFIFTASFSYTAFLKTSLFTTSLNLLKSTGTGPNLSSLSNSVFGLAKFVLVQNLKYQGVLHFLDQFLLHSWKDQLYH